MTPFIFFHGIAVNTANMLTGVIERNLDDAKVSRLYITTENSGERHALDVDYDTARDEWARVWTPAARAEQSTVYFPPEVLREAMKCKTWAESCAYFEKEAARLNEETACKCGSEAMFSNRTSTWGTVK